MFSMHKMLPMKTGGMVTYRDPSLIGAQVSTARSLAADVMSYDWPSIATRRRDNFRLTTQLLGQLQERGAPLELVWPDLKDDVPQTLPVYVPRESRDAIYHAMNSQGYGVVSLYHTLIPQLAGKFRQSDWSAAHILNLPVHQDIESGQIADLVDAFSSSLSQNSDWSP